MPAILHSLEGSFSDGKILSEKLAMRQNAFCRQKAQGGRKLAVCGMQLPVSVYIRCMDGENVNRTSRERTGLKRPIREKAKRDFAWSLENDCRLHSGCQNISKVKISSIKRDDCKL